MLIVPCGHVTLAGRVSLGQNGVHFLHCRLLWVPVHQPRFKFHFTPLGQIHRIGWAEDTILVNCMDLAHALISENAIRHAPLKLRNQPEDVKCYQAITSDSQFTP
jgi:hypothetical protein